MAQKLRLRNKYNLRRPDQAWVTRLRENTAKLEEIMRVRPSTVWPRLIPFATVDRRLKDTRGRIYARNNGVVVEVVTLLR